MQLVHFLFFVQYIRCTARFLIKIEKYFPILWYGIKANSQILSRVHTFSQFSLRKFFLFSKKILHCQQWLSLQLRVLLLERMHHLRLHKIHQWMIPYSYIMQRARVQFLLHSLWLVERTTQHGLQLWGRLYSPRKNWHLLMILSPYHLHWCLLLQLFKLGLDVTTWLEPG